jgi:hypothetical protein
MDVVLVTYAPDLNLLRHAVASYDLYWRDKDSLIIFASQGDRYLLDRIPFPSNTRFVYREEIDELAGANEFRQQIYLKLRAHEFVDTDDFVLLDSDFILIDRVQDADFFSDGKGLWYYRRWSSNDLVRERWRESERFLGFPIEHAFLHTPQWLFRRRVCEALEQRYDLRQALDHDHLSEFLIYGAFAYRYFPDEYRFVDELEAGAPPPLAGLVNQVPPTFCELDPQCSFEQFSTYKYVAFWSHWGLAEAKMAEFFEASQRAHLGSVVVPVDRSPLSPNVPLGPRRPDWHRYVAGLDNDGWVSDHLSFAAESPPGGCELRLEFMVPENPHDASWALQGSVTLPGAAPEEFRLEPGEQVLALRSPSSERPDLPVDIRFGGGFCNRDGPDTREFRALFNGLDARESPDGNRHTNFSYVASSPERSRLCGKLSLGPRQDDWYRYVSGLHKDGWITDHLSFLVGKPVDRHALLLELMVPANPDDPHWKLRGHVESSDTVVGGSFEFGPGDHVLPIRTTSDAPASLAIRVYFDGGFCYRQNADTREFRALLKGIRVQRLR